LPYKQHFTADLNPIARQPKLLLFEGSVFKNSNMNVRGAPNAVCPPLPFPPSFPLTALSQLQMLMKGSLLGGWVLPFLATNHFQAIPHWKSSCGGWSNKCVSINIIASNTTLMNDNGFEHPTIVLLSR